MSSNRQPPSVEDILKVYTHRQTAEKLLELAKELEACRDCYEDRNELAVKLVRFDELLKELFYKTGQRATPVEGEPFEYHVYNSGYLYYLFNFYAKAVEFMTFLNSNAEPIDANRTADGRSEFPIKIIADDDVREMLRHLYSDAIGCAEQVDECWDAHTSGRRADEFYLYGKRKSGSIIVPKPQGRQAK